MKRENFAALGHGISDTDTGELLDISEGELYESQIVSIKKGAKGMPGELSGYIEYEQEKKNRNHRKKIQSWEFLEKYLM